eukprot:6133377-Pleurochrysis_carterae.AAC.1
MNARAVGRAYRVSAWESADGDAFFNDYLKPLLRMGWAACVEEDAAARAATLAKVPARYRLVGTGFTQATVSLNKPTPVHTDFANIGLTCLIVYDVSRGSESLRGGSHVLVDAKFQAAVVLSDSADGICVIG